MSELLTRPDPGRLDGALMRYRDLLVLRWMCEQYAARLDHLEVLSGRGRATVHGLVRSLRAMGFVRTWLILVGEPTWVIPTTGGLRRCGLPYHEMTPRSTHLPYIAAMNEVRLHIQMRSPETLWVSRRELMSGHPKGACVPGALAIFEGREVAIEVRLDTEPTVVVRRRLQRLERRFDAVVCFCAPKPHRQLRNLKKKGEGPRLELRELPNPGGAPAEAL